MKDTSILSGKYNWIWQEEENVQTNVLDPNSLQSLINEAKSMGMRGLIVKIGDGANFWSQIVPAFKQIKDAGLVCGVWIYCYGDDPQGEANVANQAIATGADFLALDVELEYAGKAQAAKTMGDLVRSKYPDALITFAPFCFPENPNFANYSWNPQWGEIPYAEFLSWIDAVIPQVYWSDWPPKVDVGLRTMDSMMRIWGKQIYPIGQAYSDSYTPNAYDYELFEQTCHTLGYTGVSFWRAGTMDSNMQAAITKMNFLSVNFTTDAAQKVIADLGALYNASADKDVQQASHYAADQLRLAKGIIQFANAYTSFSIMAAQKVIADMGALYNASASTDVQHAAHYAANSLRLAKNIAA